MRAPSPPPEGDGGFAEETPRPNKLNPLLQPTPKVTGAYVETPATIKAERTEEHVAEGSTSQPEPPLLAGASPSRNQNSISSRRGRPSAAILVGNGNGNDKNTGRSTAISTQRRARSLSRIRSPLVNSAKPPTVKEDLMRIHRLSGIDDSTLDDIGDFLAVDQLIRSDEPDNLLKLEPSEFTPSVVLKADLDRESDLARYDRMSKSLQTGLLGIQSAKRGIERLEDKVSHPGTMPHTHTNPIDHESCPLCGSQEPIAMVTYIHIPLPRLLYRQPKFKFTILGLIFFLLALWYSAESTMCHYYCRPQYCPLGKPCDWTPDDPFFGYAIPVKLDQWVTGGQGRALAHHVAEEASDWLAEAWDALTGTDLESVDMRWLSFEQKRQHRRRLRRRGLIKPWTEPPEHKAKLDAWRSAREAHERVQDARAMGYPEEDESMNGDEKVKSFWG